MQDSVLAQKLLQESTINLNAAVQTSIQIVNDKFKGVRNQIETSGNVANHNVSKISESSSYIADSLLKGIKLEIPHFLVDLGSTYNFVQAKVSKFFGLTIVPSSHFNIMIRNGSVLAYDGKCPDVKFTVQNLDFHVDFYVLPILGAEIVLWVQWL